MKPCHENNGAVIYVGSAATRAQSFVLMFTFQTLLWFVHSQGQNRKKNT